MSLLDAAGVVTGDIWCTGAFSFESPLKDLLDSGEYTLEQLLAEDELLQELRGVHPQLIEFFSTEDAVTGLVRYVILAANEKPFRQLSPNNLTPTDTNPEGVDGSMQTEDTAGNERNGEKEVEEQADETQQQEQQQEQQQQSPMEDDDLIHIKFPYMACEVICCEINGIIDTLVDGYVPGNQAVKSVVTSEGGESAEVTLEDSRPQKILDLLFSLLYGTEIGNVDDYRAGYFDKILSVLFRKRPQAMSQYVNNGGGRGNASLMKAMFKHLYSHSIMQIVQRLLLPQAPIEARPEEQDESKEGEDLYADTLAAANNDMDGLGAFRCNWSESDVALDLLLECLMGPLTASKADDEEEEERILNLCQNASEVLITIIQNSPLTSPTLKTLTTDPVLNQLISAASFLRDGEDFSPHDSKLTCTMNVLESLVLQLGGYGSVGTVMMPEDGVGGEGSDGMVPMEHNHPDFATSTTLIDHLPLMLDSLCKLLQHPSAEKWVSSMQFSKTEPQMILGSSRLRIVRLLESLVLLGDPDVDSLLCQSNCLETCLDLFWRFQWCSMLHQSVANLLVHVFEGANARAELQSYFMVKCNLLGRLMDSFWESNEEGYSSGRVRTVSANSAASITRQQSSDNGDSTKAKNMNKSDSMDTDDSKQTAEMDATPGEASAGPDSGDPGREPAEDTAVDARDTSAVATLDGAPAQSFRLGYMGHVIIICQALVHACSNDGRKSEPPSVAGGGSVSVTGASSDPRANQINGDLGKFVGRANSEDELDSGSQSSGALHDVLERGRAVDSVVTDETPTNPLILAQLVDTHPLRLKWQEFVLTTLASETAIQSTPLGGFHNSSGGVDPLHSHRPGMSDDGEFNDDDGAAPPLPPRGLLVGGDAIDMDDADLEIAANMMAGLSVSHSAPAEEGNEQRNSNDLLAGIAPQEGAGQPENYEFDDPLGDGRLRQFSDDEDDEHSSDEESGTTKDSGDSGVATMEGIPYEPNVTRSYSSEADDVPVMDLFAGNFENPNPTPDQGGGWSNFANFDDAFTGGGEQPQEQAPLVSHSDALAEAPKANIDDLFGGKKDHTILLDEGEESPTQTATEDTATPEADSAAA